MWVINVAAIVPFEGTDEDPDVGTGHLLIPSRSAFGIVGFMAPSHRSHTAVIDAVAKVRALPAEWAECPWNAERAADCRMSLKIGVRR